MCRFNKGNLINPSDNSHHFSKWFWKIIYIEKLSHIFICPDKKIRVLQRKVKKNFLYSRINLSVQSSSILSILLLIVGKHLTFGRKMEKKQMIKKYHKIASSFLIKLNIKINFMRRKPFVQLLCSMFCYFFM